MKRIPKIALIAGACLGTLGYTNAVFAQAGKTAPKETKKAAPAAKATKAQTGTKMADGFTKLPSGLEYKIVKHGPGKKKPEITDHIEMHIHMHIKDSSMFDSRKMNGNKPVPLPIAAARYNGDPMEGFMLLVAGDSAIFRVPVDTMKKMGAPMPPWVKPEDKVEYNVALVSVRTDAEEKKFNEEFSAKQNAIDEVILREYFSNNKLKPMRTASGLYYTISSEGSGDKINAGQKVSVNYTGKFMSGKPFDSNTDSNFHHVQPFDLEVGKGRVIKGWDEGIQLLKKGSKATFYVPSSLAYGSMEQRGIPSNSILIFDVEITDVVVPGQQATNEEKQLKDYFAKNNLKAEKTQSGLYYTITKQGTGENAHGGQKVSMNYTGKLLNGTVFDSNVDPKFNHVQPFDFTLGAGQVIRGWDEGVALLKQGSKATLYIPSALGYGEQGAGGAIPPNAVLLFDVEVLNIAK